MLRFAATFVFCRGQCVRFLALLGGYRGVKCVPRVLLFILVFNGQTRPVGRCLDHFDDVVPGVVHIEDGLMLQQVGFDKDRISS